MKTQNIGLTIGKLAHLGFLDEVYDLYQNLIAIVSEAYYHAKQESPDSIIWPSKFDSQCKKTLNTFFRTHSHIFSARYNLNVNNYVFSGFSMYEYTHIAPLRLQYSFINFSDFIKVLERTAIKSVYQCMRKETPYVSINDARAAVLKHIEETAEIAFFKSSFKASTEAMAASIAETPINIWVYKCANNSLCVTNNHVIENRTLCVPLLEDSRFVNLPVRYCKTCKKYFVSDQTLMAFEESYGQMLIRLYQEWSKNDEFSKFASESELHSWGYNVIDGKLSDRERQALIRDCVDKIIVSGGKVEVYYKFIQKT